MTNLSTPANPATVSSITIPVSGMTCAACQAHVQKALAGQPGVRDASVNLMMGSAAVTFDPAVIAPAGLVDAIRETGYEADLPPATVDVIAEQDARERTQEHEVRQLTRKALVSAVAGYAGWMSATFVAGVTQPPPSQIVAGTGCTASSWIRVARSAAVSLPMTVTTSLASATLIIASRDAVSRSRTSTLT